MSPLSPEARLKEAALAQVEGVRAPYRHAGRARLWVVLKRVALGVYNDGFIHAGNLAYMSILSIFPFIIVAAAVASLMGQSEGGLQTLRALLDTMPSDVATLLEKPLQDVVAARSGTLLWVGALIGLWSVGSFIETIRDIIRRAYGVQVTTPFWKYRLASAGLIVGAMLVMLLSFSATVLLSTVQEFIVKRIPGADDVVGLLTLIRIAPAAILFGALYVLFLALTPGRYRARSCPKWPGALFVAVWWVTITALLPPALAAMGGYDLTYGSLAGVAIALIFFFLIGMGVVIGAGLNAALAETPTPRQEDVVAAVREEKAEAALEAAQKAAVEEVEREKPDREDDEAADKEAEGKAE